MANGNLGGMDNESDGIEEALESSVRMAVMVGARVGSEIARARDEQLREQRRLDERAAAQLAQRFEAEKQTALAELSQVHRPDWWDRAHLDGKAAQIGQTYATARAWAPEAEEAARAEQKMREELRERYGIDLDHTDPHTVSAKIQAEVEAWRQRLEEQRRQEADRQRTTETGERAEAALLLDQAARDDRQADRQFDAAREDERLTEAAAGHADNPWLTGQDRQSRDMQTETSEELRQRAEAAAQRGNDGEARGDQATGEAERLYDSADRRNADLRAMEAKGIDPEVAQSRMRADTAAAKPVTFATADARGRAGRPPTARRSRGAQAQLPGIER